MNSFEKSKVPVIVIPLRTCKCRICVDPYSNMYTHYWGFYPESILKRYPTIEAMFLFEGMKQDVLQEAKRKIRLTFEQTHTPHIIFGTAGIMNKMKFTLMTPLSAFDEIVGCRRVRVEEKRNGLRMFYIAYKADSKDQLDYKILLQEYVARFNPVFSL